MYSDVRQKEIFAKYAVPAAFAVWSHILLKLWEIHYARDIRIKISYIGGNFTIIKKCIDEIILYAIYSVVFSKF